MTVTLLLALSVVALSKHAKHHLHSNKHSAGTKQDEIPLAPLAKRIEDMKEVIGETDFINFENFRILMKNRGMIPGEIQFVFNTADRTKANKLS